MEASSPSDENIQRAAEYLRNGQLVAFPTETVYGLGANALSRDAVDLIFKAKGRPSDNPLIVHVHSTEAARALVSFDSVSLRLAEAFWPGPLTIVLPVADGVIANNVTAGLSTVGIRVPEHPVALSLLKEANLPLAAPSCNKSGSPSPTNPMHVLSDFRYSDIGPSMVLDGGQCRVGLESTVVQVDASAEAIHVLRPGGVSREMIAEKLGINLANILKSYHVQDTDIPRAPGMKYKHYSPRAEVILVVDVNQLRGYSLSVNDIVLCFDTAKPGDLNGAICWSIGESREDVETASKRLFDLFRRADEKKAHRIFVISDFDIHSGLGAALWNRMSKAASDHRK
jgi:L-threonylcarbamoyladenylate synthase